MIKQLSAILIGILLLSACSRDKAPESLEKKAGIPHPLTDSILSDDKGFIRELSTSHPALDVLTDNNTLYLAQGSWGVEILSLSFNKGTILAKSKQHINNLHAEKVTLSKDKKKIFVDDGKGNISILDISKPKQTKMIAQSTSKEIQTQQRSKNLYFSYIPKNEKSVETIEIAPPHKGQHTMDIVESKLYDIILQKIGTHDSLTGISLDEKENLLFVSTQTYGIQVYDYQTLMEQVVE